MEGSDRRDPSDRRDGRDWEKCVSAGVRELRDRERDTCAELEK